MYEEKNQSTPPPPPGLRAVLCQMKDHLNVKQNVDPDELTYQK